MGLEDVVTPDDRVGNVTYLGSHGQGALRTGWGTLDSLLVINANGAAIAGLAGCADFSAVAQTALTGGDGVGSVGAVDLTGLAQDTLVNVATVTCATLSVEYAGTLQSVTPRSRQQSRSTLSYPVAVTQISFKRGSASSTSRVIFTLLSTATSAPSGSPVTI